MDNEGLSDEEIAALEDEEEPPEEEKEEEDIEKPSKDEDAGESEKEEAKADEDKKDEKDVVGDEEEPAEEKGTSPFVPQFAVADPKSIEELKTKAEEALEKYEAGEIEYPELDEAKNAYNRAQWESDFSTQANKNMAQGRWQWEQQRFLDDNDMFKDNETLNAAFVSVVNKIIQTEDSESLTDRQVLAKAKKQVEKDLGLNLETPKPESDKKREAIKAAKAAKGDRSKIDPDIGGLPSAGENEDTSEFGYLDKLEGEKYQAAIDKLSPEQLKKYEDN